MSHGLRNISLKEVKAARRLYSTVNVGKFTVPEYSGKINRRLLHDPEYSRPPPNPNNSYLHTVILYSSAVRTPPCTAASEELLE